MLADWTISKKKGSWYLSRAGYLIRTEVITFVAPVVSRDRKAGNYSTNAGD